VFHDDGGLPVFWQSLTALRTPIGEFDIVIPQEGEQDLVYLFNMAGIDLCCTGLYESTVTGGGKLTRGTATGFEAFVRMIDVGDL
jgi:hypothetical protein